MNSTILLIMSDAARASRMANYLQLAGTVVHTAESALEALTQLERLLPEAIVCDAQLEDMSGLELLEIVRSDAQYEQVVFLLLGADETAAFGLRDAAIPDTPTPRDVVRELRLILKLGSPGMPIEGSMEALDIEEILQALGQGRSSGRLRITVVSTDVDLWLQAGHVQHARYGLDVGDAALQAIVEGTRVVLNADFTFEPGDLTDVPQTVVSGIEAVLPRLAVPGAYD